ncbi:MAG: alpha-L-fucosidase [Lentisphaeria bacterium]|nr:alpha-L-fucosidase [Lentisphaeria bacterium]
MALIDHFNGGRVPHARMLAHPETYVLIHFGLNTYTDKEWGYGDEDPALFNPVDFDADAIASAVKAGGFEGMILVCKHHDGFCLWPTKTTEHNISRSPWRNGRGDMVREFADAARRAGLAMGFYVSPWDRNHPAYGTEEYVQVYRAQLQEIYTQYGPAFEAWFDGANGGDGYYGGARETRRVPLGAYYGWQETWGIVRKLQPEAAIFSDVGPDLRWVGNELGYAKPDSFASTTPALKEGADPAGQPAPGYCESREFGCGDVDGKYYIPPECDVPLRPGWFYHAREDERLRSLPELVRIYLASVGSGGYLNLGISPDRRGLLHENDVARLAEFGIARKELFRNNIFRQTCPLSSGKVFAGSVTTPQTVNLVELREDLSAGERVTEYTLTFFAGNQAVHTEKGTAVGRRRLKVFSAVQFDRWELQAVSRDGEALNLEIAGFMAPEEYFGGELAAAALTDRPDYRELGTPEIQDLTVTWHFPKAQDLHGFILAPFDFLHGLPERYLCEVCTPDGVWQEVSRGEFANIRANPIPQVVEWETAVRATAIRLTAERLAEAHYRMLFREFGVLAD